MSNQLVIILIIRGFIMNIRDIRKHTGLTQKDFAELYHISLPTLRRWEQNVTKPPVYLVELLKNVTHYKDESLNVISGTEGNYYYDKTSKKVYNDNGDCIKLNNSLSGVKKENLGLYLDELFESLYNAKDAFFVSCEEDKRSDIIWSKP